MKAKTSYRNWLAASCGALALSVGLVGTAQAQLSTATIRGTAEAGATVTATQVGTGFTATDRADAGGSYALPGLRPGTYRITAGGATRTVTVQVGQTADLDFVAAAESTEVEELVVTGARTLAEVKTSEIATNVTETQIQNLPQNNRNFLNFAALAPGVRTSRDEFRQTFSGGANGAEPESLGSSQVNVFIDGVSLKSSIQQGGTVGQDASRGNPFSQLAVKEFRVSTQNFKAEYEQAASSIITAVTKSGTNEFHGEVFGFYQNDAMVERDFFVKRDNRDKPDLKRLQYGAALGGPIIQDKLFFFANWEVNDQTRSNQVTAGGGPALQALVPFDVTQYEGSFDSPFREDLVFGKLTWLLDPRQVVEVSASYRKESDVRSFGGQTSFEAAEDIRNEVLTGRVQHTYRGDAFLNEFTFDVLDSTFAPSILNPDLVGRDYQGVIRIGGRDTAQEVSERNFTFRDNITFNGLEWHGDHIVKAGAKVAFQKFEVQSAQFTNPVFTFINDPARNLNFSFPAEARFGTGTPSIEANNIQVGLFIQDDWEVNEKLTLNLGLRWDYETNANNSDFVTPPDAVAALRFLEGVLSTQPGNFFDADDYISTGSNREPFMGAIQPRIGLSYDVFADRKTVLFAGAGRYYDRNLFRNAAEESLFRQFVLRTFQFSLDGLPRNGQPTILWNPSYLSVDGLNGLIATGLAPNGELRVLKNDQKPPHVDQFSIGVRQKFGEWQTSLTFTHQRGYNEIAYFPANRSVARNPGGFLDFIPVPGFGNIVASSDDRETRFTGVYVTAEKPYTEDSRWGVTFAYTYAQSDMKGYLFNFDFPNVAEQPFFPNAADEHHRIVASGIVGLPWGFKASTLITLSTGAPFFVIDASQGFGQNIKLGHFGQPDGDPFAFKQVDLRLAKEFELWGDTKAEIILDVFNVFNSTNFSGFDGFIPPTPEVNSNFGRPGSLAGPPRGFQLGLAYRW